MTDPKLNDTRLLFPGIYLKAADLQGKEVTLTIQRVVAREEVKTERGADGCMVLYFDETAAKAARDGIAPEKQKRLILNKTNNLTIVALYGENGNLWTGKRITLVPAPYRDTGKIVVKPVMPPEPKSAAAPTTAA